MNSKYYHIFLKWRIELSKEVRFSREGLNNQYDLEKWKTEVFPYLITSLNYSRSKNMT